MSYLTQKMATNVPYRVPVEVGNRILSFVN
jgi:hypothetical protein